MQYAILTSELKLAKELIQQKITLHVVDQEGNTPLHSAAMGGDLDLIKELYDHHAIAAKNKKGQTPLHVAIEAGQSHVVSDLLVKGADRKASFVYETLTVTPLAFAIIRGELECVKVLCKDKVLCKEIIKVITEIGNVLHLAVNYCQIEVLVYLLQEHTEICKPYLEQGDIKEGRTPFALAVLDNNAEALQVLLAYGSNVNAEDSKGRTPLHYAAMAYDSDMIKYLYMKGCKVNAVDHQNKRPFDIIAEDNDSASSTKNLLDNLEKQKKTSKVKPPSFNYQPPENLVFKGGGPKGIAYLGVVKRLEERGMLKSVKRVAGTSAGAINATFLAFNFSYVKMHELLSKTDLTSFFDHNYPKTASIIETVKDVKDLVNGKKSCKEYAGEIGTSIKNTATGAKDAVVDFFDAPFTNTLNAFKSSAETVIKVGKKVKNPIQSCKELFADLRQITGICEGKAFRDWIENSIKEKTNIDYCTFGDLRRLIEKGEPYRHLHVFATRLSEPSKVEHFNSEDKEWDDVIISDAVQASMSIPGVFKPHTIHVRNEKSERTVCPKYGSYSYVDGGIIYNFPLETFDRKRYIKQWVSEGVKDYGKMNMRTLGFSLYSDEDKELPDPKAIKTIDELLCSIVNLFSSAEDKIRQMNSYNMHRVVEIHNQGVGLMEFNLSAEKKEKLIQGGADSISTFLDKQAGHVQESSSVFNLKNKIHVKSPHPHSVCRKKMLQEIDEILLKNNNDLQKQSKIHTLYGPAGVGKSELAITFANNHIEDFSLIWSISCGTPQEMENDYRLLAEALKIKMENHDTLEIIVKKVHNSLEQIKNKNKPWLIIFDNLNTTIPLPERNGVVLITSYSKNSKITNMSATEVPPFSPEEALV